MVKTWTLWSKKIKRSVDDPESLIIKTISCNFTQHERLTENVSRIFPQHKWLIKNVHISLATISLFLCCCSTSVIIGCASIKTRSWWFSDNSIQSTYINDLTRYCFGLLVIKVEIKKINNDELCIESLGKDDLEFKSITIHEFTTTLLWPKQQFFCH